MALAPPEPVLPPLPLDPPLLDEPPEPEEPTLPPLLDAPPDPVAPPLLALLPPLAVAPPLEEDPPEPPWAPPELQAASAMPISGTAKMEYQESPFTNASAVRFTRVFCANAARIVKQFYNP